MARVVKCYQEIEPDGSWKTTWRGLKSLVPSREVKGKDPGLHLSRRRCVHVSHSDAAGELGAEQETQALPETLDSGMEDFVSGFYICCCFRTSWRPGDSK